MRFLCLLFRLDLVIKNSDEVTISRSDVYSLCKTFYNLILKFHSSVPFFVKIYNIFCLPSSVKYLGIYLVPTLSYGILKTFSVLFSN